MFCIYNVCVWYQTFSLKYLTLVLPLSVFYSNLLLNMCENCDIVQAMHSMNLTSARLNLIKALISFFFQKKTTEWFGKIITTPLVVIKYLRKYYVLRVYHNSCAHTCVIEKFLASHQNFDIMQGCKLTLI